MSAIAFGFADLLANTDVASDDAASKCLAGRPLEAPPEAICIIYGTYCLRLRLQLGRPSSRRGTFTSAAAARRMGVGYLPGEADIRANTNALAADSATTHHNGRSCQYLVPKNSGLPPIAQEERLYLACLSRSKARSLELPICVMRAESTSPWEKNGNFLCARLSRRAVRTGGESGELAATAVADHAH